MLGEGILCEPTVETHNYRRLAGRKVSSHVTGNMENNTPLDAVLAK